MENKVFCINAQPPAQCLGILPMRQSLSQAVTVGRVHTFALAGHYPPVNAGHQAVFSALWQVARNV